MVFIKISDQKITECHTTQFYIKSFKKSNKSLPVFPTPPCPKIITLKGFCFCKPNLTSDDFGEAEFIFIINLFIFRQFFTIFFFFRIFLNSTIFLFKNFHSQIAHFFTFQLKQTINFHQFYFYFSKFSTFCDFPIWLIEFQNTTDQENSLLWFHL